MPTAKGTFIRESLNRVKAVFVLDDGVQISFPATVSPSIQAFTSNAATLTYDDPDQLTSTHSYSGRIGINDFVITLDNGTEFKGTLNVPGISPANTVTGTGAWESN
ncbi:hypothetical protein B0I37DRAFT_443037 [Chaetomium sp. MPI-CAGE-AT-0009]|nr:hypothetical protein B0I37DRAFT_443037 [Chaetomium sp. MPI-CAGE-AT-0009]